LGKERKNESARVHKNLASLPAFRYRLNMLATDIFGRVPGGPDIHRFTLRNAKGMMARVMTYGAALTELHAPGAEGQFEDVVLGFDHLEGYLQSPDYFSGVIGRVCGRMAHGRFSVDGKEYALVVNDPPNHLHGGLQGFDKRVWSLVDGDENTLRLRYCSAHGEEGYPGEVEVTAGFHLTDANEFVIQFTATTTQTTPLCLTQHNYFNLGGPASTGIHDHRLTMFAQDFIPTLEDMTLSDREEEVHGKANDFNHGVRIGDVLNQLWKQHGDMYRVRRSRHGDLVPAARLEHPASGRILNVATTEDCIQFYSGKHLRPGTEGKGKQSYSPHAGLCLNCQGYPNGATYDAFGSILLRPGQVHRQQTVLAFRAAEQERCSR
jgi:aldose 1-epimerase